MRVEGGQQQVVVARDAAFVGDVAVLVAIARHGDGDIQVRAPQARPRINRPPAQSSALRPHAHLPPVLDIAAGPPLAALVDLGAGAGVQRLDLQQIVLGVELAGRLAVR